MPIKISVQPVQQPGSSKTVAVVWISHSNGSKAPFLR